MNNFIYVFSIADKERMVNLGYTLISADDSGERFTFLDKDDYNFDLSGIRCVRGNTLTF